MDVKALDHVNILTGDLERTMGFLTRVLGLEDGPRTSCGFIAEPGRACKPRGTTKKT